IIIVSSRDIFKSTDGGDSFITLSKIDDMRLSEFKLLEQIYDSGFNKIDNNGLFLGTTQPFSGGWEQIPSPLVSNNAWIHTTINANHVAAVIPEKNQVPPKLAGFTILQSYAYI